MTERPVFYRYRDEVGHNDTLRILVDEYVGVQRTRKSWWVVPNWVERAPDRWKDHRKRVEDYEMNGAGTPPRRFAYPVKEHALRAYHRRKAMQLGHAKAAMARAEAGASLAVAGLQRLSRGEPAFVTDDCVVVMTGEPFFDEFGL
jgi:hypothetical protein